MHQCFITNIEFDVEVKKIQVKSLDLDNPDRGHVRWLEVDMTSQQNYKKVSAPINKVNNKLVEL